MTEMFVVTVQASVQVKASGVRQAELLVLAHLRNQPDLSWTNVTLDGAVVEMAPVSQVRQLKNALARYGQHTLTCAKRGCPANRCDCGFFEAQT